MGASCSKTCQNFDDAAIENGSTKHKSNSNYCQDGHLLDVHDQKMHKLMKQSLEMYTNRTTLDDLDRDKEQGQGPLLSVKIPGLKSKRSNNDIGESSCGQYHLLFKHQQKGIASAGNGNNTSRRPSRTSMPHDKENAGERQHFRTQNDGRQGCEGECIRSSGFESSGKQQLTQSNKYPTRLVQRRQAVRPLEEGISGNHIYAVRWPAGTPLGSGQEGSDEDDCLEQKYLLGQQEQCPKYRSTNDRFKMNANSQTSGQYLPTATSQSSSLNTKQRMQQQSKSTSVAGTGSMTTNARGNTPLKNCVKVDASAPPIRKNPTSDTPKVLSLAADVDDPASTTASVDHLFQPSSMCAPPKHRVKDWITISAEHNVYVVDVGLTPAECDRIVAVTEQVCRGQYAAYTYAKQTLGCREFPELAEVVHSAVHSVTHSILEFSALHSVQGGKHSALALDDREPHMVKYDVTKKERQKLDMHTDKSEWTFLLSLSNGCGFDYAGGGTYFECLDSTIHIQLGHALIFPGKLRHCGQRITWGLRFLLVGFLVDKSPSVTPTISKPPSPSAAATSGTCASSVCIKNSKDPSSDSTNKQQQVKEDATLEPANLMDVPTLCNV